ncbi:B3/4 domain-containing protein [Aquitalea sp. LB_tupeE]|uniref:B3/B4 domain-containing protein n=1 Tax=Aquitalea sp. LB_tupeE TaxID=2748078 RepID=UPI0015BBD819|nr:B3/4 domain-containing protein [Aquitalea sp. LB_tupeE]NWK78816.1 B3/4 domain-containing protein [Aquitalea sp. LB_tupeE]
MHIVHPSIDPRILSIAPGFRALSITVEAGPIENPDHAKDILKESCEFVVAGGCSWGEAHMQAWAEVFRQFGAKPQRTPCSAEALRKRVIKDGTLTSIDPIVDVYNAISIKYAVPVGGENIAAYAGTPFLTIADGTELFDTIKEGKPTNESPDPGEVVWKDDIAVTCRRWNWRQGLRTRLGADAKLMWFILETLPAMPLTAVEKAGQELVTALRVIMPEAKIHIQLIQPIA